jgi:hypothetical protein
MRARPPTVGAPSWTLCLWSLTRPRPWTPRPDAKRIERRVRQKHASSKRRQQAARAQAARAGYRTNDWSAELRLQAGSWALDQLLTILPDVFVTINESQEKGGPERVLTLTAAAETYARDTIADLIRRNPVWLPKTKEPPCWTDWDKGGHFR